MNSICSAALPRVINCLVNAQDLLDIQECSSSDWQRAPPDKEIDILWIKLLVAHQPVAHEACRKMEDGCKATPEKHKLQIIIVNLTDRHALPLSLLGLYRDVFHISAGNEEIGLQARRLIKRE